VLARIPQGSEVRGNLAADQQQALVAQHDVGQVALHHHAGGAALVERFDDGAQVHAIGPDAEDAHAAHAVQRLEDDVLVLCMEGADGIGLARHQRGRRKLRELHQRELLGVVAQRARAVEDARAFALGLLQQVRGVEELAVERRVLAHQHGVEAVQRLARFVRDLEPRIGFARQRDVAHLCRDGLAALPMQVLGLAGRQRVTAPLQLAHHREGGVLVDLEGFERVGDNEDFFHGLGSGLFR
jgi:hypothetical protein